MTPLAILDADGPEGGLAGLWLELVGQLHPAVVHFPVALLLVAAALELANAAGAFVGRASAARTAPTAFACLTFGALGAAAAAFSGWTLSERMVISERIADTVEWHRWASVAAAGLALAAWLPALLARREERRGALRLYRTLLLLAAGTVGYTGHLGGTLVHGADALSDPLEALIAAYRDPASIATGEHAAGATDEADPGTPAPEPPAPETPAPEDGPEGRDGEVGATAPQAGPDPGTPAAGAPAAIAPAADGREALAAGARALLGARCVECHGPVRAENGTRFDSRAAILDDFLAFEEEPDASPMIERVELPVDDEEHMPTEGEPLTTAEVALLRDWIAAGLPWPADGAPATEPGE